MSSGLPLNSFDGGSRHSGVGKGRRLGLHLSPEMYGSLGNRGPDWLPYPREEDLEEGAEVEKEAKILTISDKRCVGSAKCEM